MELIDDRKEIVSRIRSRREVDVSARVEHLDRRTDEERSHLRQATLINLYGLED